MSQTLIQKDQRRNALLRKLEAPKNTRALIVLDISDKSTSIFLREAGEYLNIVFIEGGTQSEQEVCDACITDGLSDGDLVDLIRHSVVPIVPQDHPLITSLQEFDPMKFEGNAFIYGSVNPYLIFEKLVRYLENIRYTGDKRILLNNVGKTF